MKEYLRCPECGYEFDIYKNPVPTADILIEVKGTNGIVLVKRKNPPYGWAIPGGYVDYGEALEQTAVREAKEETGLEVTLMTQFHTYSDPNRDPRHHTITTVFIASAHGEPHGGDDAAEARVFTEDSLPSPLAFDHAQILRDYFEWKRSGKLP